MSPADEFAPLSARATKWGLPVLGRWKRIEPEPARAISAPQISLTVIHVQAGAHLSLGAIGPGIIPAIPQRDAVTATEGTRDAP